jgi:hypothetical protein
MKECKNFGLYCHSMLEEEDEDVCKVCQEAEQEWD